MKEKFTNIFWYDTETTGLSPEKHSIVQLAYILEVDGEVRLSRDLKMRPSKPYICPDCKSVKLDVVDYKLGGKCGCGGTLEYNYDAKALEINNTNIDEIMTRPTSKSALIQLIQDLGLVFGKSKALTAGFNIKSFDNPFLEKFINDVSFGTRQFYSYFYYAPFLDVYPIMIGEYYKRYYMERRDDPPECIDFKLKTCKKLASLMFPQSMALGQEENFHDALYDINTTRNIHKALMGVIA